jgi:putative transposase
MQELNYLGFIRHWIADATLEQNDTWTTDEVRTLIFKEFNVGYTGKQIGIILKDMGMRYAKPFTHDYRRPKNAEEILKKVCQYWMKM